MTNPNLTRYVNNGIRWLRRVEEALHESIRNLKLQILQLAQRINEVDGDELDDDMNRTRMHFLIVRWAQDNKTLSDIKEAIDLWASQNATTTNEQD